MGGLLCSKYLENFDFLQIPAGENLDAAIFAGVEFLQVKIWMQQFLQVLEVNIVLPINCRVVCFLT